MADYISIKCFSVEVSDKRLEPAAVSRARKLQYKTKQFNGEYKTGLLWGENEVNVPDSSSQTTRILKNKKCKKNKMEEYDRAGIERNCKIIRC